MAFFQPVASGRRRWRFVGNSRVVGWLRLTTSLSWLPQPDSQAYQSIESIHREGHPLPQLVINVTLSFIFLLLTSGALFFFFFCSSEHRDPHSRVDRILLLRGPFPLEQLPEPRRLVEKAQRARSVWLGYPLPHEAHQGARRRFGENRDDGAGKRERETPLVSRREALSCFMCCSLRLG